MFDFSPVGILIASLGVLFIALIGWRLIPKGSYKKLGEGSLFSIDEYITEIRIPKDCRLIGLKIGDIEKFTDDRLTIFGRIDDKGKIQSIRRNKIIQEKDRFLIKSDPIDLKLMMDEYGLRLIKKMRERIDKLKDDTTVFRLNRNRFSNNVSESGRSLSIDWDFPTRDELVAGEREVDEIRKIIDVDSLEYLSLDGTMESTPHKRDDLCTACFSGKYPIEMEGKSNQKISKEPSCS